MPWTPGPPVGTRKQRQVERKPNRSLLTDDLPTTAEQASGMVSYQFGFANLAASQTALQATRDIAGTQSQVGVRMPYAGSIIALGYEGNESKTAGTATFVVYIAAEATLATVTWSTNNAGDIITFPASTYPFDPQELVDVRVTTDSSFAPTTVDVDIMVYVAFLS